MMKPISPIEDRWMKRVVVGCLGLLLTGVVVGQADQIREQRQAAAAEEAAQEARNVRWDAAMKECLLLGRYQEPTCEEHLSPYQQCFGQLLQQEGLS